MMKHPSVPTEPVHAGQYVVDFGDHNETGATYQRVATLLESKANRHLRIYRIHRVEPNGRMELVGVPAERFQIEDCFLFYGRDADRARGDFNDLVRRAAQAPPPCRAKLQLARLDAEGEPYVVALIYPAEFSNAMSAWLTGIDYAGGETAEGGVGRVAGYLACARVLERVQLWGTLDGTLPAADSAPAAARA